MTRPRITSQRSRELQRAIDDRSAIRIIEDNLIRAATWLDEKTGPETRASRVCMYACSAVLVATVILYIKYT